MTESDMIHRVGKMWYQQHQNYYPGICTSELERDEPLKRKLQIPVIH